MIKIVNIRVIIIQILVLIVLCIFVNSCSQKDHISNSSPDNIDSTNYFINQSKVSDIGIDDKLYNLNEAYRANSLKTNDSLKTRNLLKIIYEAKELNDTSFIKKIGHEAIILSQQLKDTFSIAYTHFSLGYFYYSQEAWEMSFRNYYQAYENFDAIGNDYYSGTMLLSMANVQGRIKDYTGSEINTFKAISIFESLDKNLELYRCYNHLGLVYNELSEYKAAIDYHVEAFRYLNKEKNKNTFIEGNLNNIGLAYQNSGNHKEAIIYFNRALRNKNLKVNNLNLYARLCDNIAYSKFKHGGYDDFKEDFFKALKLRDSVNNVSGVALSKLHLAEYYVSKADTFKAIDYASDALKLTKSVNNNRDWLASLKLLSILDHQNADIYLSDYIKLNDSLQEQERIIRNKFTRISFETDEYIQENERLTFEKSLIFVIGGGLLLTLTLLYFIKVQRSKNKELRLEAEHQRANEEIYGLMLQHGAKLEEGRLDERNRISEELHDGVLGKLFGARVGLGFLTLEGDDETIGQYKSYVEEMQQIEKEIRDISHDLKNEILSSRTEFIPIVDQYVKELCVISNIEYNIISNDEIHWDNIDDKIKVNVFRIVQEAVQNVIKHAKATSIHIEFSLEDVMLQLSVEDDGRGFIKKNNKKGIGLKNIQSRIEKFGGTLDIISKIDKGTIITASFPIKQ